MTHETNTTTGAKNGARPVGYRMAKARLILVDNSSLTAIVRTIE